MTSGYETLRRIAPQAGADLSTVAALGWEALAATVGPGPAWAIVSTCADVHDLEPLATPGGPGGGGPRDLSPDAGDPDGPADRWPSGDPEGLLTLEFVTQCTTDVGALTDQRRRGFVDALGPTAAGIAAGAFVADFVPRSRAALDALFGASGQQWADPPPRREGGTDDDPVQALWQAFDALIRSVPRLSALDPVTSELVRLRGARQHRCRLCQSLRSRPALVAGADDALFDAVDRYDRPDSGLTEGQRAALAFGDALIWTPGRIPRGTVAALQEAWSEAEQVELVLDVTRNALNKVAVALGADAAHVDSGIEIYDIDEAGELVYGLSLDGAASPSVPH